MFTNAININAVIIIIDIKILSLILLTSVGYQEIFVRSKEMG